jgi:4'-phosphopantetheinyl transferase
MTSKEILILYTKLNNLSDDSWRAYMQQMPDDIRHKIDRYHKWEDKQARLFGKLLILRGLQEINNYDGNLEDLSYDKFGRLFYQGQIDINISHADEYVVCAFASSGRVGIDIEKIKPIDVSEIDRHLTADELENIRSASDPSMEFYKIWTSKESIIKADGRGLLVDIKKVLIKDRQATLLGNSWFLTKINIDPRYFCHLATNQVNPVYHVKEAVFD